MEIYVKQKDNNNNWFEKKLSLFGDEEIELTKNWNDKQYISGYGSYSTSFSVPIDANNQEIFKYYDIIGGLLQKSITPRTDNFLNPVYFIPARIVVNEYEIVGNLQMLGFSLKKQQKYAYNLTFYGSEKNFIRDLNNSKAPKLNDVVLSGISFNFTSNNIMATWIDLDPMCYVPLMATKKPLVYRDEAQESNINGLVSLTSGITMSDLAISYNFKKLMEQFLSYNGFTFSGTTEIYNFLEQLYIMPNTKIEMNSRVLYISSDVFSGNLINNNKNILTFKNNLEGNLDTIDFNRTTNEYTVGESGRYSLKFVSKNIKFNPNFNGTFENCNLYLINTSTNTYIKSIYGNEIYSFNPDDDIDGEFDLLTGTKFKFCVNYTYSQTFPGFYEDQIITEYYEDFFSDNEIEANISFSLVKTEDYDYTKSKINFVDMFISDFLINFCKSFNIFFIYDDKDKIIKLYFKDELPSTSYDLSRYLILDKEYTFNHNQKYKLINYKFEDGKDVNNIIYKKNNGTNLAFGEYKKNYNYDVGIDKLEYKSIFTVFPKTFLNKTDNKNNIIISTGIPLHSELDESNNAINTDFLLFYRLPIVNGVMPYNLQNSKNTFVRLELAPDYGPTNYLKTYSLDYSFRNKNGFIKLNDNVTKKYETQMDFILPTNILYKLNIYDYVVIHNIWYEISEITTNIKTGYSKIKLITK